MTTAGGGGRPRIRRDPGRSPPRRPEERLRRPGADATFRPSPSPGFQPLPTPIRLSSRSRSILVLLLAAALAAAGCREGPERASEGPGGAPDVEGAELLAGAGPARWSLLTVPLGGGVARARALDEPGRVVWEGRTELPPSREVRLVEGPAVLLLSADGTVRRYDPRGDRLTRVGSVAEGARWSGWDRYGLWVEPDRSSLLEVGPEGSWRYELAARPTWATPVEDGRVAAVVESGGGEALWLVGRGENEPQARARNGFSPPGLVTAWGRRLVLPAGEALRFFAVPSLTASGEVAVGGPVTALAASPSSHELYVGVDDPPGLVRVARFAMQSDEMVDLPRPARALRPAVLGGAVLVHDGGAPLVVPVGGGDTARTAGRWREDLPLALPDGRVVVLRDDGPAVWSPGGRVASLDVPAERRWAAVRWNPAPPPVVADRVSGEAPAETARSARGGVDTGADTAGVVAAPAADTVAAPDPEAPPPGFYAVMSAARDPDGVYDLLGRLASAGYPTQIQVRRDDAGRRWYRALVGPYEERSGAEAAARQLRRERGASAWVTEIRAGATTEEIFR